MTAWRAVPEDDEEGRFRYRLDPVPDLRFGEKQCYVIRPDDVVGASEPETSRADPEICHVCDGVIGRDCTCHTPGCPAKHHPDLECPVEPPSARMATGPAPKHPGQNGPKGWFDFRWWLRRPSWIGSMRICPQCSGGPTSVDCERCDRTGIVDGAAR